MLERNYNMKYLKRFNESNTDDVIENIKDILLPVCDMGYDVTVKKDENRLKVKKKSDGIDGWLMIKILSNKPANTINVTSEIKSELSRLKDYLESEGYNSINSHFGRLNSMKGKTEEEIELAHISGKAISAVGVCELKDLINSDSKNPIANLTIVVKKIL